MATEEPPWHAAFPEPTVTAPTFKKENLVRLYQTLGDVLSAGLLLIDLRRTDYDGGTIRGSLNVPAQSFYFNMGTLYRLCKGDGVNVISRVIFYCGSSTTRPKQFRKLTLTYSKVPHPVELLDVPPGSPNTLLSAPKKTI